MGKGDRWFDGTDSGTDGEMSGVDYVAGVDETRRDELKGELNRSVEETSRKTREQIEQTIDD